MSRSIGFVEFADGERRWLIHCNTMDRSFRTLYATLEDANLAWKSDTFWDENRPDDLVAGEVPVEICEDHHFTTVNTFWYPSRASTDRRWLTGPDNALSYHIEQEVERWTN